eukprot:TRINITY_DN1943_c0_g1_i4.p1 TRINITY_DN1943_c0_g1~~TRINITY_DN1943_c0_g1_i4.p1  ORF type:complete len:136 (-),score=28.58 TRINITY_DN1943_c0_g1_i4:206-613(-)
MKFLVVLSALAVAVANGAPQLLYGGYGLGAVHAIPTVAKQTIKYKTAAFEPVDAATPADAQLISLKETEHSHDILVPGPSQLCPHPCCCHLCWIPLCWCLWWTCWIPLWSPCSCRSPPLLLLRTPAAEEPAVAEE